MPEAGGGRQQPASIPPPAQGLPSTETAVAPGTHPAGRPQGVDHTNLLTSQPAGVTKGHSKHPSFYYKL